MSAGRDRSGLRMDGEAGRWMTQAHADLRSAEILLESARYYLVCFLSQQIAEKALKAYLYHQGRDLVFGHSVASLCDACAAYDGRFADVKAGIKNLDQYYIEALYPNGLPDGVPADFFDSSDGERALRMARTAIETVEQAATENT